MRSKGQKTQFLVIFPHFDQKSLFLHDISSKKLEFVHKGTPLDYLVHGTNSVKNHLKYGVKGQDNQFLVIFGHF